MRYSGFCIKVFISCFLLLSFFSTCRQENKKLPDDFEIATAWAGMANYITRNTAANTPTFASRCFGYIGLTMYESIVNGYPESVSKANFYQKINLK